MMFPFLHRKDYQYTPVNGGSRLRPNYSLSSFIIPFLVLLATAVTSFYAGRYTIPSSPRSFLNLSTHSEVFRYNRTFGAAPSNATDTAWDSIFPDQGGFFRHPQIAPERSAWAVFHQLHCLNGIRQGYWGLHAAATAGTKINDSEIPMMQSPPHIRHCIDLIRHSLMCQPDTTLEVKDEELGGVTGFGTEHECRSWDELVAWTTKWQTWEQAPGEAEKWDKSKGKGEMHNKHGHEH